MLTPLRYMCGALLYYSDTTILFDDICMQRGWREVVRENDEKSLLYDES